MALVDLHVHSRLSKSFAYDPATFERFVRLGKRRGLSAFASTEHIHAVDYWGMHDHLSSQHPYSNGAYHLGDDFVVLTGTEITVAERVDFIVVGPLDEIASLDRSFRPWLSEWNHPPADDLMRAVRERDLILILAHPFREGKQVAKLGRGVFDLVHAVEVNGRDCGRERITLALAEKHGLPVSGGSDAHFYLQVGIRSTVVPGDDIDYQSVRRAFEERRTRVHAKPYAQAVVTLCQQIKRVAKSQIPPVSAAVA